MMDEAQRKKIRAEAEAGIAYADQQGIQRSDRDIDRLNLLDALSAAEAHIGRLREALFLHRADMHSYSRRPCPTCRRGAEALGIVGKVPDACARAETDRAALDAEPVKEDG